MRAADATRPEGSLAADWGSSVTSQAVCVECRRPFTYRRRGAPQVTCSPECRRLHRSKGMARRVGRWAVRQVAIGVLGYPERLACRSVPDNASQRPTCDELAAVLYFAGDGMAHALCATHDTDEAVALARGLGMSRLPVSAAVAA